MKNKAIRIATYILAILPLLVLTSIYTKLPEQVPMHWDFNGTVSYEAKSQLWIMFSLGIVMSILFDVLPKIDPKRKNYQKFGKYYDLFAIGMVIFIDIINTIIIIESFYPNTVAVGKGVIVLLGILFIFLGNIMPKIKTNFYMGVRTPWAISNPDVWNKTHRLGGRMMFVMGILSVIAGLFMNEMVAIIIVIGGALCMTIIPTIMSYIWYRQTEQHKE